MHLVSIVVSYCGFSISEMLKFYIGYHASTKNIFNFCPSSNVVKCMRFFFPFPARSLVILLFSWKRVGLFLFQFHATSGTSQERNSLLSFFSPLFSLIIFCCNFEKTSKFYFLVFFISTMFYFFIWQFLTFQVIKFLTATSFISECKPCFLCDYYWKVSDMYSLLCQICWGLFIIKLDWNWYRLAIIFEFSHQKGSSRNWV